MEIVALIWNFITQSRILVVAFVTFPLAFTIGYLIGRIRTRLDFEGVLLETQDKLEWERMDREAEIQKLEEQISELISENGSSPSESESEKLKLLRKELQRLYATLQKSWLSETRNEQRIRQLEATIAVLMKNKNNRTSQTELEL